MYDKTKKGKIRRVKVYLEHIGTGKVKEDVPSYIWVNYSYVAYMNRRSNGAMFPIVNVFQYVKFWREIDDIVRLYETYKNYTSMYNNISENQFQGIAYDKINHDRDLQNLLDTKFLFEEEPDADNFD